MAQITRIKLSGSTDGKNIKVVATATPGTLIHTAAASDLDEIYIDVHNSDTVARDLTIEFGGVATPDDLMVITVPSKQGWQHVITGISLSNTLVVRAFGSAANVLVINGYVLRVV